MTSQILMWVFNNIKYLEIVLLLLKDDGDYFYSQVFWGSSLLSFKIFWLGNWGRKKQTYLLIDILKISKRNRLRSYIPQIY